MKRNFAMFSKKATLPKKTAVPPFVIDDEYKLIICKYAYIGKKGYTIPKTILNEQDEKIIKTELMVKPELFGAVFGGATFKEEGTFPVYRENANKIYLPRFYGIQRYGLPYKCELEPGEDISVEFSCELRDYQKVIVDAYINYVKTPICVGSNHHGSGGILQVYTGGGKTIMAIKIIAELKKKTLILVHKEFLMNQWIERINEFLPGARIGKIQGQTFDIENKDIVLGMIQSLYDKDYPTDTFSHFGLTIIDEVHRIGSEQFSKTLLKTITPYMLGISATVDRKDKLTKILYMFIGEMIHSCTTRDDSEVCVRAIEYKTQDTEFNETEFDFRGNPQYSKMIVKLCNFGPRSDFIVRVISDLLEEHPDNQIMILAHNRSLLTYLHDAIQHRKIASVGYYLGGMKQAALDNTEKQQVVIATYAMAAEALDIKTLATLVMVTPKTDIIQSVGRILRTKHEHSIIVDIVDAHDIFQNQWKQRMRYYKKCNYRIHKIDSTKYTGMINVNETLLNETSSWKRVFEPKVIQNKVEEEDDETVPIRIGTCLIPIDMEV